MKTTAQKYHQLGLNIVLVDGKKPLVEWRKFQTERQSLQEFEKLHWHEASGFAIICGQQITNGLYFGVVDFDVKNLLTEVIEKGKGRLKKEVHQTASLTGQSSPQKESSNNGIWRSTK